MIWSTYECDHIYFSHACICICIVVFYRYFHADLNKSMTSTFSIEIVIDLKNDDIDMFNNFQFLFRSVFILANRFFEMNNSFNRFFLYNSIIAECWSSFSINDQKFLDEHRFEIEEILNIENQNSTSEILSIRYSDFNLILEWRLLQCLKFLVYLFLDLIVDFLVFND
jgi:hypothetical protein